MYQETLIIQFFCHGLEKNHKHIPIQMNAQVSLLMTKTVTCKGKNNIKKERESYVFMYIRL